MVSAMHAYARPLFGPKKKSKSTILLCETVDHTLDTGNGEAYEVDGVINIRFIEVEEKPKRDRKSVV